jgi:NADH-quinone oxidoreductase subunit A
MLCQNNHFSRFDSPSNQVVLRLYCECDEIPIVLANICRGFKIFPVEDTQLTQYVPVLILGLAAIAFSAGTLVASVLIGKLGRRSRIKDTAYECGMLPVGEGSTRLSVKFYLVAMLFILFDIEVVFLYPWAVVYKQMLATHPALILGSMLTFMGILFVGYIYALKKRAFDWKS